MDFMWVCIGDKNSCEDCISRDGEVRSLDDWEGEGPGAGHTDCMESCRCELVPVDWIDDPDLEKTLDEVADKFMEGIIPDVTSGKQIVLKYFQGIEGLGSLPYETIQEYETLIGTYNEEIGPLPDSWYELKDINKQIDWLEKKIK